YVVYGAPGTKMKDGTTSWAATNSMTSSGGTVINGTNGFRLDGSASESLWAVTTGDIHGNGYPVMAVSSGMVTLNGKANSGGIWIGDAQPCSLAATNNLDNVVAGPAACSPNAPVPTNALYGSTTNDGVGYNAAVGDINGDGIPDMAFLGVSTANGATAGA